MAFSISYSSTCHTRLLIGFSEEILGTYLSFILKDELSCSPKKSMYVLICGEEAIRAIMFSCPAYSLPEIEMCN